MTIKGGGGDWFPAQGLWHDGAGMGQTDGMRDITSDLTVGLL